MRRASPRAPRREKSSFSLQLIKGIMVVENRLCCPWLLMSCLQAANEDCIEFCCLSYYITLQSSVETSSERWPSAVRVSKTLSRTIVFYVYGEQKGNSLDALLFFFTWHWCLYFAVITPRETSNKQHVCCSRSTDIWITRCRNAFCLWGPNHFAICLSVCFQHLKLTFFFLFVLHGMFFSLFAHFQKVFQAWMLAG